MSEKIKIYKSQDGEYYYILWKDRLVEVNEQPGKDDNSDLDTFPVHYSIRIKTSVLDFLTEPERDAAFDELIAIREQAKKQLAEQVAKKAEIEAARELLKDGKRVKIIALNGNNHFLFHGRVIKVGSIKSDYVSDLVNNEFGYSFTLGPSHSPGSYYTFRTLEYAEYMRNKLIDYLARAKAQLLLEEVGG